tara:strand:+ start:2220 stop:3749 length:1530 start_codon:yes stop_codon:yes gene_type:complete
MVFASIMNVKTICIVGGGSSGWMMAIALQKKLPKIKVTLIESPNVPIIGVGEATVPYTEKFFRDTLEFNEKEWMPFCDATYKASIRFSDFEILGKTVYHPFWNREEDQRNGFDWAVKSHISEVGINDYYSSNYVAYHMSINNKFNKLEDEGFRYAHHLDAVKFAHFCKSKFKGKHIKATVKYIQNEGDNIISVTTDNETVTADMFIDCTGFKRMLIDKISHEPFKSISDTLLNDTALTCRIPYENRTKELEPVTDCTALSSGWAWNIPIWSRIGSGYVFSSKFQNIKEAKKEYKKYLTKRFGETRTKDLEFDTINIKTGHYKKGWVGNCLALPLASGFIEPLESTGLALACLQIEDFIEKINTYEYTSYKRTLFNAMSTKIFDEIHTFVLLHYVNTKRDDSKYWQYIKNNLPIPDSVINYVQSTNPHYCFQGRSRECILLGFNIDSEYSFKNLSYNQKTLNKNNKEENTIILENMKYIDDKKNYYIQKVEKMEIQEDYLKQTIYNEQTN